MLSTDRTMLTPGSSASVRMAAYGSIVDSLCIVLAGTGPETRFQLAPNVTVVSPGGGSKITNFFRLLYLVRTLSADIVSAQDPFWTGLIAVWSGKQRVQIQLHTDTWGVWKGILLRYVLHRASCVRVVTHRIRQKVMRFTGAPIAVLPIFVDAAAFVRPTEPPLEYGHEKRILIVSRLAPEKRIDRALEALTEVPHAHLYIVGDGPLRADLETRAAQLGLSERVHFLGWKNDVAGYYQHADCLVQMSAYEGYGMALMEAALAGCPIVSTNVGIVSELPSESVTLVPDSKYELAKALHATLTPERKQTAQAASLMLRSTHNDFTEYLVRYRELLVTCGT